jgi:hypothetical protein
VVKDVTDQLDEAEGIQRKGLILSTLLRLKQICNHPAQFLQDGSAFTAERSHKLQRLGRWWRRSSRAARARSSSPSSRRSARRSNGTSRTPATTTPTICMGTSATKRDRMIAEFQDPVTEPSVFVLSLRAGGVGLNLTKANHVFHFDRWWNPAVEDQATDRAFRIGQHKNVFAHKFVAMGTMEERIDAMIEDKKRLSALVVGSDESWLTELDNDTFKDLIALRQRGGGVRPMAQFSRTWWGQRFIAALEQFTDPGRLGRGRSYAHNGRILDYTLAKARLRLKCVAQSIRTMASTRSLSTGPRSPSRPFRRLSGRRSSARLPRADLVTKLLLNEMPDTIEDVFSTVGCISCRTAGATSRPGAPARTMRTRANISPGSTTCWRPP